MEEKVFYNICPSAGCHQNCALKLWVRDGKICKVESAEYPDDPDERCICLRGLSSTRLIYHPDRLKYPLKRVGNRGEGKWQRISWDEAFDTIASKLLEIKEKYGPQSVKVSAGGSSSNGIFLMGGLLGERFANVWGAGGFLEGLGWGDDGAVPAATLLTVGVEEPDHMAKDFIHSRLAILWSWNPAISSYREMKAILDARDKGVKIVVIGPVFDATAAKADWWIPIRSGTDGALALAMINVIINKGLYDKEYITKYTVGPFLVREDNGLFLRDADKYLVWDERANTHGTHDSVTSPAIAGNFTVNGIRCKPAFQLLIETASQYTVEKTAEITRIPAETIKKLALEYASSKPAAIKVGFAMSRTLHGCLNYRAIITLAAIAGNIGVHGGGASMEQVNGPTVLNNRAVSFPPGAPGMKTIPGARNAMMAWTAIREGKPYPIKAFIKTYGNPVHCHGHIDGWREIYSQMDLVVISDIFLTRTAQNADIVLPEASIFERDDLSVKRNYILRLEKAIEPLYEAKSSLEIFSELARRVGLGEYFKYTPQEYMKMLFNTDHPSVAGITFERLDREKIVRANLPFVPPIPFADKKFPTPSGRIEFYQESLVEFGEELPVHKEALESPSSSPLAEKYPLTFFTVKCRLTTHSMLPKVDWLREIIEGPFLDINPLDAQKRDIKDNDVVVVFNDRGMAKLKARLNEAVPPGAVNVDHGWWPDQFLGGHYSDLLHRVDDPNTVSPSMEIESIVSGIRATSTLIHYDCLVEVQKAQGDK